jgi:hypothetical protein
LRRREQTRQEHRHTPLSFPSARDNTPNPASPRATHLYAQANGTDFVLLLVAKASVARYPSQRHKMGATHSVSIQAPQIMAAAGQQTPVANALIIARPVKGTTEVATGAPIPATTMNRPHHDVY